jgi:hypothetical protein
VPTFADDVTDVAGLARIGEHLFEHAPDRSEAAGTISE